MKFKTRSLCMGRFYRHIRAKDFLAGLNIHLESTHHNKRGGRSRPFCQLFFFLLPKSGSFLFMEKGDVFLVAVTRHE
jgi:hypothetical protein